MFRPGIEPGIMVHKTIVIPFHHRNFNIFFLNKKTCYYFVLYYDYFYFLLLYIYKMFTNGRL